MDTYSPHNNAAKTEFITFWELYKRTPKAQYGEDILIREIRYYKDKINGLTFEVSLVSKENQPREVTRTIVDINMKEFKNHSS